MQGLGLDARQTDQDSGGRLPFRPNGVGDGGPLQGPHGAGEITRALRGDAPAFQRLGVERLSPVGLGKSLHGVLPSRPGVVAFCLDQEGLVRRLRLGLLDKKTVTPPRVVSDRPFQPALLECTAGEADGPLQ